MTEDTEEEYSDKSETKEEMLHRMRNTMQTEVDHQRLLRITLPCNRILLR